ncbi:MAG: hypothetical protein J1F02_02410 [Lachnospiraceae bacterium]|nr:hypothetical protein [Lachnospiraceae bacterium]
MRETYDSATRLVVEDTTIYEVDMECYQCLSEQEKEEYFGEGKEREAPVFYDRKRL